VAGNMLFVLLHELGRNYSPLCGIVTRA
jgi:hypothetical protein